MERPRLHVLSSIGAVLLGLGCQSLGSGGTPDALGQLDGETLTTIVAELKMHLREDGYRFSRALTSDGRDVVAVSLWKLDRLQRLRAVPRRDWENVDLVLEFARARALERLRRYAEAREAFERVAASGSVLSDPAFEAAAVMARFSHSVDEPGGTAESELARIQSRVVYWRRLAYEFAGTSYQSLALQETEAWQMLGVDSIQRTEESTRAISSCNRLIEENRSSKLYSRHLIRLGDLYADQARSVALHSRTEARHNVSQYEQLIDRALAAYELAAEDRRPSLRKEATTRIDALLAYHQGTLAYAQ